MVSQSDLLPMTTPTSGAAEILGRHITQDNRMGQGGGNGVLTPLLRPAVGQLQQTGEWEHETGKQRGLVVLALEDDSLLVALAAEDVDGHGPPEAVDHPVFLARRSRGTRRAWRRSPGPG